MSLSSFSAAVVDPAAAAQQQQQQHHPSPVTRGGSIVVVAKCPVPGQSKTRLVPLLGEVGSAALAQAMLSDILTTLSQCVRI
jgi:hypothetical protein